MVLTLNKRVLKLETPGIRKFSNQLVHFPNAINLTIGQPDFPTPMHIKEAAISSIQADLTGYSYNAGLLELREEVQRFFEEQYHLSYSADNEIIVTNGASEALDISFRTILEDGDEVILFAPLYPGYEPLIELCGAMPVLVDTSKTNFKPTLEKLKEKFTDRTKAILFNYPSNPTGAILTEEDLRPITDWLKNQDVYVISDEIYSENTFEGSHVSVASMDGMRDRTILVHGLSKSHSMTGWRIGFTLAPAELSEQMLKVHLYNSVCAPVPSQYAAIQALRYGRNDPSIMNEEYIKRRNYVTNRLLEMGLEVDQPKGAFYIFPRIPMKYGSSFEFATDLLHHGGVAVVPGSAFSVYGEGYIRISYAYSLEVLEEGLNRIESFLQQSNRKDLII